VYLLRADAHNLPFGNGVLSGVSNQGALHLYSDPKQVLREVFRVLVSGGPYVATVEVRSRRRLPLLLQKLLRWGREPVWEEHVFRDLLERTGFTGYERMLLAHLLLFRVVRP
jgi:ubiquinone/menaquinone biosynthesis C-methylase UbiE